jgi:VWFA-related protein
VAEGEATEAGTAPEISPSGILREANRSLAGKGDHGIRILPPPNDLLVGNVRVEALASGEGIARVRFRLDGKDLLSKARPPYSVELNLGQAPRVHRLEVTALAREGKELARDEILLNAGPHRFGIRLLEPRRGHTYRGSLRAEAAVEVPEGEQLDRVEIFLNDNLVATLYQAPFAQPVVIPGTETVAYVRAVAYLADGNSAEDLVFVNAPEYLEELDIQLVELFTTVVDRRNRPVAEVDAEEFRVFEDGIEQKLVRFEKVTDLPIYAGLLLDTSASMYEELREVVKGALRFFDDVITPKDRAAVMTFNERYELVVRFTNDPEILAGGVAGLVAEGETYLYDSLIQSLFYFSGARGKRAILLISDGKDVGSRYNFDDALEYARRTGVAIYTIGLGLSGSDKEVQLLLRRLADETGGRAFFVGRALELGQVYEAIEQELRSQYLLAYQSSQPGREKKFRSVEVEVARPGLKAKTIRGYYP